MRMRASRSSNLSNQFSFKSCICLASYGLFMFQNIKFYNNTQVDYKVIFGTYKQKKRQFYASILIQSMDNSQPFNPDPQSSQSFYSSTSLFNEFVINRFNPKKKSQPATSIPLSHRLQKIKYQLVSQVSIISPSPLRACQFRQELRTYRFSRVEKQRLSMFGSAEEQLLRQQQNITLTFLQVMKEYRKKETNKFYLVVKKNDCVYFFFHNFDGETGERGSSYSVIKSKGKKMSQDLREEEIQFEKLCSEESNDCEEFVIKNYEISVLWGFILNTLAANNTPFDLVANFPFMNACEDLPQQIFNGNEFKKQFQHLAIPKKNFLDEEVLNVYRMKMEGLWMGQNIENLAQSLKEKLGEDKFQIEFNVHRYSPDFSKYEPAQSK